MSCVNLIIEDTPSLQRLLNLDAHGALLVSVISAPKLETLGCLSDHCPVSKLVFGTTVIQVAPCLHEASSCISRSFVLPEFIETTLILSSVC